MMNVLNFGLHFKCAELEHGRGISDVRLFTSSVGTSRSPVEDLLRLIINVVHTAKNFKCKARNEYKNMLLKLCYIFVSLNFLFVVEYEVNLGYRGYVLGNISQPRPRFDLGPRKTLVFGL